MNPALDDLRRELQIACNVGRYPVSGHEALGVLQEEFDEFKASVYADAPSYSEALQVAAVAVRIMEWLRFEEPGRVECEMTAFLAIQRKREPGRKERTKTAERESTSATEPDRLSESASQREPRRLSEPP